MDETQTPRRESCTGTLFKGFKFIWRLKLLVEGERLTKSESKGIKGKSKGFYNRMTKRDCLILQPHVWRNMGTCLRRKAGERDGKRRHNSARGEPPFSWLRLRRSQASHHVPPMGVSIIGIGRSERGSNAVLHGEGRESRRTVRLGQRASPGARHPVPAILHDPLKPSRRRAPFSPAATFRRCQRPGLRSAPGFEPWAERLWLEASSMERPLQISQGRRFAVRNPAHRRRHAWRNI